MVQNLSDSIDNPNTFIIDTRYFELLASRPFAYWISGHIINKLSQFPPIEDEYGQVKVGLQTGEDARFLRLLWEVSPHAIGTTNRNKGQSIDDFVMNIRSQFSKEQKRWAYYSKTDTSYLWYAPIHLVVDWDNDGDMLKNFRRADGYIPSRVQNEDFYFRPSFSYMNRSTRIVPYIVPAGVIPTAGRSQVYPNDGMENYLLSYCASNIASAIARFNGGKFAWPKFQAGMIQNLPVPDIPETTLKKLSEMIKTESRQQRVVYQTNEPYLEFIRPAYFDKPNGSSISWNLISLIRDNLEKEIAQGFGLSEKELRELERDVRDAASIRSDSDGDDEIDIEIVDDSPNAHTEGLVSYIVGSTLGRWDIRYATGEQPIPDLPDPFDPLPACPPGMLQGADGLPLTASPPGYPLDVVWDGMLVDDEGHPDDIIGRVRSVLALLWDDPDAIEAEMLDILKEKSLRGYFRKSSNSGFWMSHVKRYSKSRRKAPIYWYLQSANGNYGLWLYYHRLSKDLYYQALEKYVRPKLALEQARAQRLRNEGESARVIAAQDDLVSEIHGFHDALERVAALGLEPDLNDGVVLNIAPLHELVPWKEAAKYWKNLLKSEYEWSTISGQLRERGIIK